MNEIKNALIKSTSLGVEDHGCLTCFLHLDYGGTGQGFGGWSLDAWRERRDCREGTAWGMEFIRLVLETLEVPSWEALKGQHVRVSATHFKVESIGHIIKDKWFNPEEDLKHLLPTA